MEGATTGPARACAHASVSTLTSHASPWRPSLLPYGRWSIVFDDTTLLFRLPSTSCPHPRQPKPRRARAVPSARPERSVAPRWPYAHTRAQNAHFGPLVSSCSVFLHKSWTGTQPDWSLSLSHVTGGTPRGRPGRETGTQNQRFAHLLGLRPPWVINWRSSTTAHRT